MVPAIEIVGEQATSRPHGGDDELARATEDRVQVVAQVFRAVEDGVGFVGVVADDDRVAAAIGEREADQLRSVGPSASNRDVGERVVLGQQEGRGAGEQLAGRPAAVGQGHGRLPGVEQGWEMSGENEGSSRL